MSSEFDPHWPPNCPLSKEMRKEGPRHVGAPHPSTGKARSAAANPLQLSSKRRCVFLVHHTLNHANAYNPPASFPRVKGYFQVVSPIAGTMPSVFDLFSLEGRTALLTGATRGIGQSLAIALAEAGSDIVLIQRPQSKDTTTKDGIEKLGRKANVFYADLASSNDMAGLVKRITDAGHHIDILVNCGGIQRRHPAHQFPDDDWNEVCKTRTTVTCPANNLTSGPPSQSQLRLHNVPRRWSVYAHKRAYRQSATSRIDHQRCIAGLFPRRVECSGLRSCQRRSCTANEEFVESVGSRGY